MFIIYAHLPVLNVRAVHSLSSLTFPIPSTLLAAQVTRHKQLHFCLVPGYLHSWLSNEQRVSINELKSAWFSWLTLHRSGFPANWHAVYQRSVHTQTSISLPLVLKTPSSWTAHKCNTKICKRTEAGLRSRPCTLAETTAHPAERALEVPAMKFARSKLHCRAQSSCF